MTDQNDDGKKSNKRRHPSVTDKASPSKKGPWSAVEDKILQKYVRDYGEGYWDLVKEKTGLRRSATSCRLRWDNQLRPDLKQGPITLDEAQSIAELQAQMGNEWTKIAVTDEASPLKQGPWSADEDKILQAYVQVHGARSWNSVQKKTGLRRSGKSCYFRWDKQLRPDLKKGPITRHEAQLIAELHADMGNKWTKIAAQFPGRTDNEIKNYWNSRAKKLKSRSEPLNQAASMVNQGISSPNSQSFAFPTLSLSKKRPMETQTKSAGEKIPEPIGLSTQYDSYLSSTYDLSEPAVRNSEQPLQRPFVQQDPEASFSYTDAPGRSLISSIQAEQNTPPLGRSASSLFIESSPISGGSSYDIGWFSSQDQASAQQPEAKATFEQMQTGHNALPDNWSTRSFSLPSFGSVDTSIQSPPVEQIQSERSTNSGLFDPVLCGLNSGKCLHKSFVQQYPEASFSHTDAADGSSTANPNTPFGQSASSSFSESTPISGTSSSYDPGCFFNHEAVVDPASTQQPEEQATSEQTDISGTNVLPGPYPTKDKWRK